MPPSSVLSTRYRTARRYPVICRGPTTLCRDVALLLARCGASASAGAAVKWCQFDDRNVRAGYYAARSATRQGIRVRRCYEPGIARTDSRVTLSRADRLPLGAPRISIAPIREPRVILCSKRREDPYSVISLTPRAPRCPERRRFSIPAAAERKQQNAVTRSRRPAQQLLAR